MTSEQIEQAQVPELMAQNAKTGRVLAVQNARLHNLADDVEWVSYGIHHWWIEEANQAAVGRAGLLAVIQGSAWMLGKIHGVAAELAYQRLDDQIDL